MDCTRHGNSKLFVGENTNKGVTTKTYIVNMDCTCHRNSKLFVGENTNKGVNHYDKSGCKAYLIIPTNNSKFSISN